ncbi:FmdB family zinc ribbon protein [Massilia sp. Leaf139]|uniref:FmdB family zinc ribbon protein n=1 Tax=Massilia sp. Leaf139 TaxID=1736272 RepID=UPI0006FFDC6B|nr:FmdB family zinc ribbon protein [Massilia sp. Leaf139]KQQ86587.1 FmdB family transcriptional regulator [Massilia sp. Leaf139]
MPIYAYRCDECGFSKDVLQKISDPVLTTCLSCGKDAFKKQVTAAGFQLKGTGWYVTDFRGGKAPATGTAPATGAAAPAAAESSTSSASSESSTAAAPVPAAKSDTSAS